MNGVTVGIPYSQEARDTALAAIGGDGFSSDIVQLLQQTVVEAGVDGSALPVTTGAPFSNDARATALGSIGATGLAQTWPDLLQQLVVMKAA